MKRRIYILLGVAAVLTLIWGIGFVRFVRSIPDTPDDITTKTDAIVVLTGGSNRLNIALDLLDLDKGEKLLISGMGKGITLENLKELETLPGEHLSTLEDRIALGYIAENTRGNAEETAIWMQLENYKSLRLVTANYHIPRSVLEFSYQMPNTVIIPHPVAPDNVNVVNWWQYKGSTLLLISEYHKYLGAYLQHTLF